MRVHRATPMANVNLCQHLLLLVVIPNQSDTASYQSGEMLEEINRTEADMTNTAELQ
jgi:hypothetical protein